MSGIIFSAVGEDETLSKKVASKIEDAICDKKFESNRKLPTVLELCSQFKVSSSTIREALKLLSSKGLISSKKGKGIYVNAATSDSVFDALKEYLGKDYNPDNINEIMDIRLMIEPTIAEFAAICHNENNILKFQQNIAEMKRNTIWERHCDIDMDFHLLLAESTQNPIIQLMMTPIEKILLDAKSKYKIFNNEVKELTIASHRNILNGLMEKDSKKAFALVKQHILMEKKLVDEMLFSELKPAMYN